MREADPHDEMEKALMRLMPAALSGSSQDAMLRQLDELAGTSDPIRPAFPPRAKWFAGLAAALAVGILGFSGGREKPLTAAKADGITILMESDRVENVRDEGLFVDAGGSAVRKLRVRVVGESRMLDEETGIEVTLTSPREEMVLLPVSTF